MRSLPLHRGTASACPAIHTTWKRRDPCRTSHRVPTRPRALSASFAFTPPDRNGKLEIVDEKGGRTTIDGTNLPPSRNIDEDWIRTIRGEKSAPAKTEAKPAAAAK